PEVEGAEQREQREQTRRRERAFEQRPAPGQREERLRGTPHRDRRRRHVEENAVRRLAAEDHAIRQHERVERSGRGAGGRPEQQTGRENEGVGDRKADRHLGDAQRRPSAGGGEQDEDQPFDADGMDDEISNGVCEHRDAGTRDADDVHRAAPGRSGGFLGHRYLYRRSGRVAIPRRRSRGISVKRRAALATYFFLFLRAASSATWICSACLWAWEE